MNKLFLEGHLGKDAVVRETSNGGKFLSMTIVDNQYENGEPKAYWYDVTAFNFNDKMVQYYKKGASLTIVGTTKSDIEEGKDGVTRCRRKITADSIDFTQGGKQQQGQQTDEPKQTTHKQTTTTTSESEISMYSSKKKEEQPKPKTVVVESVDDESELPF